MAELFDNKIVSLGLSYIHHGRQLNLSSCRYGARLLRQGGGRA